MPVLRFERMVASVMALGLALVSAASCDARVLGRRVPAAPAVAPLESGPGPELMVRPKAVGPAGGVGMVRPLRRLLKVAKGLVLGIPARRQAPWSSAGGWCGETAIQEALLFHGVWVSQRQINRAGSPAHGDLYARDIPVALAKLGVRTARYDGKQRGYVAFQRWLHAELTAGRPVIAGMKIHPTEHPSWGLDHFVLVTGYGPHGLRINTTWGDARWRSKAQLTTRKKGLSFKNRYGTFYGLSIRGLGARPAVAGPRGWLQVERETPKQVALLMTCSGLRVGQRYRVERFDGLEVAAAKRPAWQQTFTATRSSRALRQVRPRAGPARYHCLRAAPSR